MPSSAATDFAVVSLSPVAITILSPCACSLRIASAAVSLMGSATAMMPASLPPAAKNITVSPCFRLASAACARGPTVDAGCLHQPGIAESRVGFADASFHALTGDRRKARHLGDFCVALEGAAQDGLGEGVLAHRLERGSKPQHLVFGEAVGCFDAGQRGLALGESSGLVDDERVHRGEPLERGGIAHQHAGMRAASRRHHDRDGRGKAERARAGDDQHAHRGDQRISERRGGPEDIPGDESDHRNGNHGRDKIGGDRIGERAGSARASAAPRPPWPRPGQGWFRRRSGRRACRSCHCRSACRR